MNGVFPPPGILTKKIPKPPEIVNIYCPPLIKVKPLQAGNPSRRKIIRKKKKKKKKNDGF